MTGNKWLIAAACLALIVLSSGIGITRSSFVDMENSSGNDFQAWAAAQWVQTSQADFEAGVANQVDTTSSPGDVKLSYQLSPPVLVGSWTGETDFGTNGFNYTPGAGSNRIALVMVTAESNSTPVANINQVTLGGQVLTAIENADGVVVGSAGSYHNLVWLGYLDEAGIGNMSGNVLNVTWDTAPSSSPIMVQAATYQSVDQAAVVADSASNTNAAASLIQAGNVSVGSDDRVVYVTVCGNPEDHTAPGGYTEQLEQDGGSGFEHSDASVQRDATTAGTENPTATWSGTQRLAIISAVFNGAVTSNYVSSGTIASQVWDTGIDPTISPPVLVGSWTGEADFVTNGFNYTPGAGSNRIALVMVTAESDTDPVVNMNQVTLGGQVLTAIENADGVVVGSAGSYHNLAWLGYLDEAGIGNMSGNTVNVTWDTAPTGSPIMVQAATYQSVDQSSVVADSASNTNAAASSIQAGNVSVGSGDRVVYVTVCGNPADHTAPGGYTEQLEQDGGSGFEHSDASVQRDATTAGTENPTATWSGTQRLAIISTVFNGIKTAGAIWNGLFWDETLPAGTDIVFEVRASDTLFAKDAASPGWTGVGGTSPVISGLPSGRYIQWRATLSTTDPSETPVLHEVRVYYY